MDTFTAHLSNKYNYPLYKISKRNEKNKRPFGYNVYYQNITTDTLKNLPNILITAVDKHYWHILYELPENTRIVIHDPTELKPNKKKPNPLIQENQLLKSFRVYTIRETVQKYIIEIHQDLLLHQHYSRQHLANLVLVRQEQCKLPRDYIKV